MFKNCVVVLDNCTFNFYKKGDEWITHLDKLAELKPLADDPKFQTEVMKVKQDNKIQLSAILEEMTGVKVNPASMFDIQVKRIHEYKRQFLLILHLITQYNRIKKNPSAPYVARTIMLGNLFKKRIIFLALKLHNFNWFLLRC